MHRAIGRAAFVAATATVCLGVGLPAVQAADSTPSTSYVSPTGSSSNDDSSCSLAGYNSVQTAVTGMAAGGTVVVCAGTYHESVTLTTSITLEGVPGAVIDATGQPYGVGIGASGSTVKGLTIENAHADQATQAPGDGIVTAGFINHAPVASSGDTILGNVTRHNDGAGIDLISTVGTLVSGNVSEQNGVGINIVNDFGKPSAFNLVTGNTASNNPGGCGIVLADHTGSGIFDNVISGNTANGNGLGTPSRPNASSGSGIILAAGGKGGGVYRNVLRSNRLSGNGHGGVALHAHAKGPKFSKNKIEDNSIGKNNVRTDYKDTKSTGIYLGTADKLTITVAHNLIRHDGYGIFTAGHVTLKGKKSNGYVHVKRHIKSIKKYAG